MCTSVGEEDKWDISISKEIDIEELDKKGIELMNREFKKPNEKDILLYKPLIDELLVSKITNNKELKIIFKKYKFSEKNSYLIQIYLELVKRNEISKEYQDKIHKILKIKSNKSWSGITNITLFTSPYPEYTDKNGVHKKQEFSCEFNCHYCSNAPNLPRSYLLLEPAVLRAAYNKFDCVKQIYDRMNALYVTGHLCIKNEINILGGTWSSYPKEYREEFIRDVYYAVNTFWERDNVQARERLSLHEEKKINETAYSRIVLLAIECRPDSITEEEIKFLRYLSVTRIQLGCQHLDDEILDKINRKCPTYKTIKAIEMLKNIGMKIDMHFMPNLPFSNPEKDRKMMIDQLIGLNSPIRREIKNVRTWYNWLKGNKEENEYWEYYDISYPEFQVDQMKIYPTAVVIYTEIEKWYKEGKYIPYDEKYLIDILIDFKSMIFPWIRLNRIQRDFYIDNILSKSGSNLKLRCDLQAILKKEGLRCMCIRCRQATTDIFNGICIIVIRKYNASNGFEYFISAESSDNKVLYGICRLRLDNAENKIFSELNGAALLRELHIYSTVSELHKKGDVQHKGLGTILMKKAEQISRDNGYKKISVIASVGSRTFYKKKGYEMDEGIGEYMFKSLI